MLFLLVLPLLFRLLKSACGPGCLRCDPLLSLCSLCNLSQGYVASSGSCVVSSVPNCAELNPLTANVCDTCAPGFYLSSSASACLSTARIENCRVYGGATTCAACNAGFYPSGGVCVPVANSVSGCLLYTTNGVCGACAAGLVVTGGTCAAPPSANCRVIRTAGCRSCVNGTFPSATAVPEFLSPATFWQTRRTTLLSGAEDPAASCVPSSDVQCKVAESATVCRVCSPGYYVSTTGGCISTTVIISNCEVYTNSTACGSCAQGFSLIGGTCVANALAVIDCASYSSPGVCLTCAAGFYLSSANTCLQVAVTIPNCLVYATSASCSRCAANYTLSSPTTCLALPFNCSAGVFDAVRNSTTCSACVSNSTLLAGSCVVPPAAPANCSVAASASICTTCAEGNLPGCAPVPFALTGCRLYSALNTCSVCLPGFSLAANSTCLPAPVPNCARYSADSTCAACLSAYYLSTNQCLPITTAIPLCAEYSGPSTCLTCAEGYQLLGGTCQALTAGCAAGNSTACFRCLTGFALTPAGRCESLPSNCALSLNSTVCVECASGFFAGGCAAAPVTITNCAVYAAGGVGCLKCVDGSFLDTVSSTCTAPLPNCYLAASAGACARCVEGYYLDSVSLACVIGSVAGCLNYTSDNRCAVCGGEAYLNATDNVCLPTSSDPNCLVFASAIACLRCVDGSFLVPTTNTCTTPLANCLTAASAATCGVCAQGYTVSANGACVLGTVTGCLFYSSSGVCQRCNSQTYLNSTACYPVGNVQYCQTYSTATTCSLCQAGSFLDTATNTCSVPVARCAVASASGVCSSCLSGFYVSAGACLPGAVPNCLNYTSAIACQVCVAGYFVNPAGSCSVVTTAVTRCSVYSSATVCSRCIDGSFLDTTANTCSLPLANCFTAASATACLTCNNRFAVSASGACVAGTLDACLAYTSPTACQLCDYFAYLNAAACTRVPQIPNCLQYSGRDTCARCVSGYFLTANTCTGPLANCDIPASTTTCAVCLPGFAVSAVGACVAGTVANCLNYTTPTACSACQPDFFWNGTVCVEVPAVANCLVYTSPTLCGVCDQGFNLTAPNTCTPLPANCINGTATSCFVCAPGFVIDPLTSSCTALPSNCLSGPNSTSCGVCAAGFVTGGCATATPIIPFCANYTFAGVCRDCQAGSFKLSDGNCSTPLTGCRLALNTTFCLQCAVGFFASAATPGFCAAVPAVTNCVEYSAANSACLACAAGFYPSMPLTPATICLPVAVSISNCESYTGSATCGRCVVGYYLSPANTACLPSLIANCSLPTNATFCAACNATLYFNGQACVAAADAGLRGCLVALNASACAQCQPGLASGCRQVEGLVSNCADYSAEGVCRRCNVGFVATAAGLCAVAQGCAAGAAGICTACAPGFNPSTLNPSTPLLCLPQALSNCRVYSTLSTCSICVENHHLGPDGLCLLNTNNCVDYTSLTNTCTACAPGFYLQALNPSTAQPCLPVSSFIPYCQTYSSASTCSRCYPNYLLSSNSSLCSPFNLPTNCSDLIQTSPACLFCTQGFYLSNGSCLPCPTLPSGCLTCSSSSPSTCSLCSLDFYMDSQGNCIAQRQALVYNSTVYPPDFDWGTNDVPAPSLYRALSVVALLAQFW